MTATPRTSDYPIEPIFLDRWSPRAYTGEPIPEAVLHTIFEAARWAPSSYNSQPWRFINARRFIEFMLQPENGGATSNFTHYASGLAGADAFYDPALKEAPELKIPADHRVEIAIAIGKRGDKSVLSEAMQAREMPSPRQPQASFVFEGVFQTA